MNTKAVRRPFFHQIDMLGVIVPAHDEAASITACIQSVYAAANHPELRGENVEVVVVADSCSDLTAELAKQTGATVLEVVGRNVGAARAKGAQRLVDQGARWLAFTDADTHVSPSWLVDQLSLASEAVCGTVGVEDWSWHGENAELIAWHFGQTYTDADNHSHIHGANLGVSAEAYIRAGGFPPLTCSEDVAFVEALQRVGARICWSSKPRVITSARTKARAVGGFADALLHAVAQRLKAADIASCASAVGNASVVSTLAITNTG